MVKLILKKQLLNDIGSKQLVFVLCGLKSGLMKNDRLSLVRKHISVA